MARVVAGGLARVGHEVMIGSRQKEKAETVAAEIGEGSSGGTNDDVAEFAEVIIHTVRQVPSGFLRSIRPMAGKVVVDLNNRDFPRRIASEPLFPSLIALNQADVPDARFVKCFNTIAMEVFSHAPQDLRLHEVSAFVAGGDAEARAVVAGLAEQLGFRPVDMGGAENADLVEMQGDFIRAAMFHQKNFLLTSQVREIPASEESPFGERREGTY